MMEKLAADSSVIDRLAGVYMRTDNKDKKEEFYKRENLLWIKHAGSINGGYPLQYIGNNTFEYYGVPIKYVFTMLPDGSVKISCTGTNWGQSKESWIAVKES